MTFNPQTGQWEEMQYNSVTDSYEEPIGPAMPAVPALEPLPPAPQQQISPIVAEYLQSKQRGPASIPETAPMPRPAAQPMSVPQPKAVGPSSMDAYQQALMEQNQMQSGLAGAQFASSIGDALAGRDSSGTRAAFQNMRAQAKDNTIGELERKKAFAKDADLNDPNSEKSKTFRKLVESTMPDIAKSYGKNWSQVAASDSANILDYGRMRENINSRREQAQILSGQRVDAKNEKRNEREMQLAVPGYERTGEVLQKPEEAQKLRKATASAEQLQSKLSRLRDLVKQEGSFEYGGTGGAEMESLATEIQLLAKGEDMYQLGVLTGPDMSLLQKITADPASLNSLFTRDKTRLKQIDTQMKSIQDKLGSVTRASGYRPKAGAAPKPTSGPEAGMIEDGHRFKGGDPADPNNWEKM